MDKQANEAVDQVIEIETVYGIDIIGALVILILGWMVSGWAGRTTRKALGRSGKIDTMLQNFFGSMVQ
jgi:small conductance mechanosensitive channel